MSLLEELQDRGEAILYASNIKKLGDRNTKDLRELYKHGTQREKKNASLQALQLAVDSYEDNEIKKEEYHSVKHSTIDHVEKYYLGEEPNNGLVLPQTEKTTRRSGLPGDEIVIENFVDNIPYKSQEIDNVVAVASGGLEPGIISARELDATLDIVRYSTNDHKDQEVKEIDTNYEDNKVLVVDDNSYTGETINFVKESLTDAEHVETATVIEGEITGQIKSIKPHLTRKRWRNQETR